MLELVRDMGAAKLRELSRSYEHYPSFASDHEGASVLREEIEEAHEELSRAFDIYLDVWQDVRHDIHVKSRINELERAATLAAAECVQVAAMAKKMQDSYEQQRNLKGGDAEEEYIRRGDEE